MKISRRSCCAMTARSSCGIRRCPARGSSLPKRPSCERSLPNRIAGCFGVEAGSTEFERLFGYQRIGGYPLYVAFGIPRQGVLALWRANLVDYLLFAIPASLGLFCMTLFAVRQLQQQRVATWRWRATARRLNREMHRRIRAETDLHQAQKMEALGQLTGGVAHDFNNLLTVLQGCLEMLSGRQGEQTLQARVEMALATVERGERLTSQLLAFARRQPLTVARLDLNDTLRQMAELMARTVGSKVSVETDFAPDLWPIDADATQLELAVINLAINSRDAMPEGGVLRIRTFKTTLPEGVLRRSRGFCRFGDLRHRRRHDSRNTGAGVRAVLYEQGTGQRHRSRPQLGLWVCSPIRRLRVDPQRGRPRHSGDLAAAAGPRGRYLGRTRSDKLALGRFSMKICRRAR